MRRMLCACFALAALSLGLLNGGSAHAAMSSCYTDPVVTLSNGHQVRLWMNIGTDVSKVASVSYTLHIPVGLSVTNVQYDQYGSIERFSWSADEGSRQYKEYATAHLRPGQPAVSASAWMQWDRGNNTYTSAGETGEVLTVLFQS